jgi:sigma54-dependent transcription regulator
MTDANPVNEDFRGWYSSATPSPTDRAPVFRDDRGAYWDMQEWKDHIAALEATVARLTAPVTEEELRRLDEDWADAKDDTIEAYRGALTAFLERRMKG